MSSEDEERRLWFRSEVMPREQSLRAYAARFCRRGPDEVDDLVHDTFAKLIAYPGWRQVNNVSAFAIRVLKNAAFYAMRRRKIAPMGCVADVDSLGVADDVPDAERVLAGREELRVLARLITGLPPQCRKVFTLKKVYGLSNAEIADHLNLSISTVEKHARKGLRLCSEAMSRATHLRDADR